MRCARKARLGRYAMDRGIAIPKKRGGTRKASTLDQRNRGLARVTAKQP